MWTQLKQRWLDQLYRRWEQEVAQQAEEHAQSQQSLKDELVRACAEHDAHLALLRQSWEAQYVKLTQEYAVREEAARVDYLHAEEIASQLFDAQKAKQTTAYEETLATLTRQHLQVQQVLEEKVHKYHEAAQHQLTTLEVEHHALLQQREEEFRVTRDRLRTSHEATLHTMKTSYEEAQVSLQAQREVVEIQRRDLEDLAKRNEDRKVELAQVNEELKQQIRLVEAKASPSSIWSESFGHGYSKAWDTLLPLVVQGMQRSRETVRRVAIDETLSNLQSEVQRRAVEMGQVQIQEKSELLTKREEFTKKLAQSRSDVDREKYRNYLTALDWMLNGHQLPQDQALPQ